MEQISRELRNDEPRSLGPLGDRQDAPSILSDDEIARYERDGFVIPRYRLSDVDLTELQELTEKIAADNPDRLDQPIVCPHVPGNAPGLKSSPGWRRIATNPDLVDMAEQILGPDLILWGTSLFYKRAQNGPSTPWHRDGTAPIKPLTTMSAWIAVYDSVVENGCLRCIPGSHRAREIGHHTTEYFDLDLAAAANTLAISSLDPTEFDEDAAVDIELEAGQMVLLDGPYVIHGARENLGTRPRAGYAVRFMPSTSHYVHDDAVNPGLVGRGHDMRPLILVRGVDRSGRNDFTRGHSFSA